MDERKRNPLSRKTGSTLILPVGLNWFVGVDSDFDSVVRFCFSKMVLFTSESTLSSVFLNRRWTLINADYDFCICVYPRGSAVKKFIPLSSISPALKRGVVSSNMLDGAKRFGHSDICTTMIYTHTVKSRTKKAMVSPLDLSL